MNIPIVFRYTGNDMLMTQYPFPSHEAVLHPQVLVILGYGSLSNRVLDEHGRMRFPGMMHNLTLVVHQVLNGQR